MTTSQIQAVGSGNASLEDSPLYTDMGGWLYSPATSPPTPTKQPPILCGVVTPNSCGSSVWNLLMPRILRWFLDLWKICEFTFSSYGTVELFRYGDPAV